jgi:hypothetical protein
LGSGPISQFVIRHEELNLQSVLSHEPEPLPNGRCPQDGGAAKVPGQQIRVNFQDVDVVF